MVTIEIGPAGVAHWDGTTEFEHDGGSLAAYSRILKGIGDQLTAWCDSEAGEGAVEFEYVNGFLTLTVRGI